MANMMKPIAIAALAAVLLTVALARPQPKREAQIRHERVQACYREVIHYLSELYPSLGDVKAMTDDVRENYSANFRNIRTDFHNAKYRELLEKYKNGPVVANCQKLVDYVNQAPTKVTCYDDMAKTVKLFHLGLTGHPLGEHALQSYLNCGAILGVKDDTILPLENADALL